MSQGAAHTRFAFSTSVTPYKNATRKHELIINGRSLLSNLKGAASNLKQDIKKNSDVTFHLTSGIINGC